MPVAKTCEVCGAAFSAHKYRADAARYCSYACSGEARRRPVGETRACTSCERELPADRFAWTTLRGERRRRARCRECEKRARDAKTAALVAGPPRACTACAEVKPAAEFYGVAAACRRCTLARQAEARAGHSDERKRATKEYNRAYLEKNRDKFREAARRYGSTARGAASRNARSANRRAYKLGAPGRYTPADIVRLWHRQRGECACCGVRFGKRPSDGGFHVDHVVPLSRTEMGPTNWPHNLQLLCGGVQGCNQSKGAKTEAEFRRYLRARAGAWVDGGPTASAARRLPCVASGTDVLRPRRRLGVGSRTAPEWAARRSP